MKGKSINLRRIAVVALILVLVGQACTLSLLENPFGGNSSTPQPPDDTTTASATPYPVAQTTFVVTLPEPLQANESLVIAVLDDVTGLSINVTQYPMSPRDTLTYTATLP